MRKILYIVNLFILLSCISPARAQQMYGYLNLISDSQIKRILIDDQAYVYQGKIRLPEGSYRIVVQNPDPVSYQALDFIATVTIQAGMEEKLIVVFEKLCEINSYPGGAEVSVNAEVLGITPFYLSLTKYKNKILEFNKPGHKKMMIEVTDSLLIKDYVFISLEPNIINRSNNQNQFVNLEWQERGPHRYKDAILITQGLGIAFGAGAAYYKKKADDAFEKAKIDRRLGNVQQRDRHMNKTRKYDRYAAIGFIGMQVNVAAFIYFLFQSR